MNTGQLKAPIVCNLCPLKIQSMYVQYTLIYKDLKLNLNKYNNTVH